MDVLVAVLLRLGASMACWLPGAQARAATRALLAARRRGAATLAGRGASGREEPVSSTSPLAAEAAEAEAAAEAAAVAAAEKAAEAAVAAAAGAGTEAGLSPYEADEEEVASRRVAAMMTQVMGGVRQRTVVQRRDASMEALVRARVARRKDRDGTLPGTALAALLKERADGAGVADLATRYAVDEAVLRACLPHVTHIAPQQDSEQDRPEQAPANEGLPPMR